MDINFRLAISNSGEDVSRETLDKLEIYKEQIIKWNSKINLISKKSTAHDIIYHHFLDCIQLNEILKNKEAKILDVGSGGGFPGIILSILGYKNCEMIDKVTKKTIFLNSVLRLLGLNNIVHNMDVKILDSTYDIIISRAVCSIDMLLNLTYKLTHKNTKFIFLKSNFQLSELDQARKFWNFKLQEYKNKYKTEGTIIELSELSKNA